MTGAGRLQPRSMPGAGGRRRRRIVGTLLLTAGLAGIGTVPALGEPGPPTGGASITVHLSNSEPEVAIERAPDGTLRFVLETRGGDAVSLSPEDFARRVYDEQSARPWWKRILNITSVAGVLWVGLGFLGQALFTGRMLVQWIASERRRRSVVPVSFWWLSLIGASMLLVYFVWRKDIVGVVGQATGWAIYVRNLRLLYAERLRDPSEDHGQATR